MIRIGKATNKDDEIFMWLKKHKRWANTREMKDTFFKTEAEATSYMQKFRKLMERDYSGQYEYKWDGMMIMPFDGLGRNLKPFKKQVMWFRYKKPEAKR